MSRFLKTVLTASLLLSLAACTSEPKAEPSGKPPALLIDLSFRVRALDLRKLRERVQRHAAAPACVRASLQAAPEVTHALWWRGDRRTHALHVTSLQPGQEAYRASEASRLRAAKDHEHARGLLAAAMAPGAKAAKARAAAAAFAGLGDALLSCEAKLLVASKDQEAPLPEGQVRVQRVQAQALRLARDAQAKAEAFAKAFAAAEAAGHALALERLEALRAARGLSLAPPLERGWRRTLTLSALRRGRGLHALRHAQALLRASHAAVERADAQLLLARANGAAGRKQAAWADAQEAVESAERADDAELRARAFAGLGQALRGLGRLKPAAGAFQRARLHALAAGDASSGARAALNEASAWLRLGELSRARLALAEAGRSAAEPQRLRRELTQVLLELIERKLRSAEAAERVKRALARARAAGHYAVVEAYAGLEAKLRS